MFNRDLARVITGADIPPQFRTAILEPENARRRVGCDVLKVLRVNRCGLARGHENLNRFMRVAVRAMEQAALNAVVGFRLAHF